MPWFEDTFAAPRALIGMVHVGALPGSPGYRGSIDRLVTEAVSESRAYSELGYHGVIIENMHDRPYLAATCGPEAVATMTAIGREIRREVDIALGVQILAAANREALAVAHACGAAFIRAEAYVFAHVADEGILQGQAGSLLRYRREIDAESVRVLADIKKKHSAHAITADVDVVETARAAEFFLADGVVVTGTATGKSTSASEVTAVAGAVDVPVFVGSGLSPANIAAYGAAAGLIVGSWVKHDGHWSSPLDRERAAAMARAFTE